MQVRFLWDMPIYKPHVERAFCVGNPYLQIEFAAWGGVVCEKFLVTISTGCIFPIYILFTNLFTNLTLKGKYIFQVGDLWSETFP